MFYYYIFTKQSNSYYNCWTQQPTTFVLGIFVLLLFTFYSCFDYDIAYELGFRNNCPGDICPGNICPENISPGSISFFFGPKSFCRPKLLRGSKFFLDTKIIDIAFFRQQIFQFLHSLTTDPRPRHLTK